MAARNEADTREIVSTRLFQASPQALFAAFRDPARLAQWWGPAGFRNTIHEFDFRPGGTWRLTMHSPDGADYHNQSVFIEITEPARIVFDHLEPVHRFRMTITLVRQDGDTRVTWQMLFDSADECARVRPFVSQANEQNFDRLAAHLSLPTRH